MNIIGNYINAFPKIPPPRILQTPRLICKDGFSMSVQVGEFMHCSPRKDFNDAHRYTKMEVGYPNSSDALLIEYIEDHENPTETIYSYVPIEVINQVIENHGGLKSPY